MQEKEIRNFCIIAHIDHGKSTLADRLLEITGTVEKRKMQAQYLDQLELERERGITIKMAPVRMIYYSNRRITQNETQNNAEDENDLLYKDLTYEIRGAAFEVRKKLGLGHKEGVYHNALAEEFHKRGLKFESEKSIGVFYDDKKVGTYQPDFVIEDKVLIELKALPEIGHPQTEQLWSYLKGSKYKLALLVNFGTKNLDIHRVVYDTARNIPRDSAFLPRSSAEVEYILNLIDTPGHSDFGYEVSRALQAVEGGILLVDAAQGIQAQTLANFRSAKDAGLAIIGAVNKIDLFPQGSPEVEKVRRELAKLINAAPEDILLVSGKTGAGVQELLEKVVIKVPPPKQAPGNGQGANRALIFDSFYDDHKGVIVAVRVFDGRIQNHDEFALGAVRASGKLKEIGFFAPQMTPAEEIGPGEIGYVATGVKDTAMLKIGDTLIANPAPGLDPKTVALHGYNEPHPVVYVSFYPEETGDYDLLKRSLMKLHLNDSALAIEPDQNEVLGRGFKVGFLGRLHFEITAERLKREFNVGTVSTFPSVLYKIKTKNEWRTIIKPEDMPEVYEEIMEPMVKITILVPAGYLSAIFPIYGRFRLKDVRTSTLEDQARIDAIMPLAELISDFDDQLKSLTSGFASMSYELAGYEKADIVRVDIAVAGDNIPGLSRFFPRATSETEGRRMAEKLKKTLPRQQFSQAIQAKIGSKIIAREDIPAMKKELGNFGKNGGDRTRKMKLWAKQKRGKEKLLANARVTIPPELFKELLKK